MKTIFGSTYYALGVCGAVGMLAACANGVAPSAPAPGSFTALRATAAKQTRPSVAYVVLYSFEGGSASGANPYAGLINIKGTLYSTSERGGAYGAGTVYAITQSGSETVLHSFGASGDGETPFASLTEVKGTLYGTTFWGGAHDDGTVFSIAPSGAETVVHSFSYGFVDGEQPYAGLLDVNGTLYGTTQYGGTSGDGTVFSITTSGTESVLHSFGGSGDGGEPYAGLIDVKGTLYGTTRGGGANNNDGTVFKITTSGGETVLHSFGGSGDGVYPAAGLLNVDGTLYGTTESGGNADGEGTVFSITTSGTETVLHSFGPYFSGDGESPNAGLINVKGTLYGTTERGGAYNYGSAFKITRSGKESVLHSFGGSGDGEEPYAALVRVKGVLYGTSSIAGADGDGTVFWLSP